MTTRRLFGQLGLLGGLGITLGNLGLSPALAQSDRKLVIALAYGGWDPMWTINPKPDSPEVDRIPGDVQMFGSLPIWTHSSRPYVSGFFERWGSISSVINGVAVESLAHETCVDVALTGTAGGATPDIGARVAGRLGGDRALPYLALSPQAEIHNHESEAGTLGPTNQIMALTTPAFAWPSTTSTRPDTGLALSSQESELVQAYLRESHASLTAAMGNSPRTTRVLRDYEASLTRMAQLREAARRGGMLADAELFQDVESPFRHVAAALAEGVSQVALVQPDLFWDTHSFNSAQNEAHNSLFGGLDLLMSELYEHGALEDTTVLVLSEMGRTPRHNASDGKDHWPWTSAMLIDSSIPSRVIGETDEWMRPLPLNLETGVSEDEGELLHAEHVLSSAVSLLGIDPSDWYERPPLGIFGGDQ